MKKVIHFLCALLLAASVLSIAKVQTVSVEAEDTSTIPMWRLYNPYSGEHLYTADKGEYNYLATLGWHQENVGWYAPTSGDPVYRLYNPYSGDHHYTLDGGERDWLTTLGWRYEGVGWYSDVNHTVPVFRQFNPYAKVGTHNYTANGSERDYICSLGWRSEGTGWYATAAPAPSTSVQPVTPPTYYQNDGRWSGNVYGGYTLGSTGCGPTSMAMIISAKLGRAVLPPEVAGNLYNTGHFNSGGVYGSNGYSFVYAGAIYGLSAEVLNSYDKLANALMQGKLVAWQVVGSPFVNQGASHAIVVYGYNGGYTNVIDPLGGKASGQYSVMDIWLHQSNVSTDLDQGCAGFGF